MRIDTELICTIAKDLQIYIDSDESQEQWGCRVLYSALGHNALTSLWDLEENQSSISIVHFKRIIERNFRAYKILYPQIASVFSVNAEVLANEVYEIYQSTGFMYHSPNRITPSGYSKTVKDGILFHRGLAPGNITAMSGLGFYGISKRRENSQSGINEMFCLPRQTLSEALKNLLNAAEWKPDNIQTTKEYLRLTPPFSHGYWKESPDTTGEKSLFRVGTPGEYTYYLYYYQESRSYVSQLPDWLTAGYEYRNVSNWILAGINRLPAIEYRKEKELVKVKINYLLPPKEMSMLKLYSWPQTFRRFPSDFNRVFAKALFPAIKDCLEQIGYTTKEV